MDSLPERPQIVPSYRSPSPAHPHPHPDTDSSIRRRRDHNDIEETGSASSRRSRDHRSSRDEPDRDRDRDRDRSRGERDRSERARSYREEDDGRETKRRRSRSREPLVDRIGSRDDRDYERERGGRRYRDERDYDYDNRSSRRYRDEYDYAPRDRGGRRDRDRPDRRASAGPNPREDRARSPQLTEEDREMRSVFVSQLSARVTDRELGIFFEHGAGKVRDARVIVDRISKRSKGVGYVEFVELESVAKALAMTETKLLGIPIIVQYTEAEKNRQARIGTGVMAPLPGPDGDTGIFRLYVGSLNFALTDQDIRQVFQPFGEVTLVDLHKDPVTGKSKGYAFVQFKESTAAMQALEKMNNFPLAGREIRVGLVSDRMQNPAFMAAASAQVVGAYIPGQAGFQQGGGAGQGQREQPLAVDDGSGGTLSSISRIELMQKLARTDKPADLPDPATFRPNIPLATTRNVLMKNAFDPAEETERDWDVELRDDVKGEVEEKYGKVAEIFLLKDSQGEIYIRFVDVPSAMKAVAGLNGRWFGGKQIEASHLPDVMFDARRV